MINITKKLEWSEEYSVGVKLIDDQHKKMFEVINQLVDTLSSKPTKEKLGEIIKALLEYKKFHFATEEKYFDEFNYEGAEEHKAAHIKFGERLSEISTKYGDDTIGLAYELVDFLEDWLLDHLMTEDQKYKECFLSHGLR